jgi:hypothetical protein
MPVPAGQLAARARETLRRSLQLLLEPTAANVGLAASNLAVAAETLRKLVVLLTDSPQSSPELRTLVVQLREDRRNIASLLEHSAAWHSQLLQQMLQAAQGETVVTKAAPRVHLEA